MEVKAPGSEQPIDLPLELCNKLPTSWLEIGQWEARQLCPFAWSLLCCLCWRSAAEATFLSLGHSTGSDRFCVCVRPDHRRGSALAQRHSRFRMSGSSKRRAAPSAVWLSCDRLAGSFARIRNELRQTTLSPMLPYLCTPFRHPNWPHHSSLAYLIDRPLRRRARLLCSSCSPLATG